MSTNDDRSNHYPTKAHGSIPAFHSTEEEAAFFDTHDFNEFWDELEPVEIEHTLEKKMQVRLDETMDRELEQFAAKQA